jgi:hypothetical protein
MGGVTATKTAKARAQEEARLAACARAGKRRFETRDKARDEVKRVWRQARLRKYPYECACGWWHLTSRRPRDEEDRPGTAVPAPEGA